VSRVRRGGAIAGVAAPLLLTITFLVLTVTEASFLRSSGWSAVHRTPVEWPSLLALGPHGWLLNIAFAVAGVLGIAFALSAYAEAPTGVARTGAVMLLVMAVAVCLVTFNADPPTTTGDPSWHDRIHNIAYPFIPLTGIVAALAYSVGVRNVPGWRRVTSVSRTALAIFAITVALTAVDQIAQLARFVFFGALLLWVALLALAVVGVAPGETEAPSTGRR
jgi:hypothetical membrane protein